MQIIINPDLLDAFSRLVDSLQRNPAGAAQLVTLTMIAGLALMWRGRGDR